MEFDPQSGGMKCRFCGHTEAVVPAAAGVSVHTLEEGLAQTGNVAEKPHGEGALEVTCNGCGSVVAFQPPEVAGVCPFCASAIVAPAKAADALIAPDGVLPAKVPQAQAQTRVRQWLAARWFAPNALKRMAQQEGIAGVYLPFWDWAADTDSRYTGERGQHYWETEYYTETDSNGNTVRRERQVQRTRWYPAAGRVTRKFDNVLIAATRSVNEARLNALQPWDLEALCAYAPAWLAGFRAQRYQVELPEGFDKAKQAMAKVIDGDVRKDIGGDEQRVLGVETATSNATFRHLLLPVWIGAYRFKGKAYQVVVNARTGEVQGERPWSVVKVSLLVAAIVVVIVVLVMMTHR
jgi:ribosomal protein S27E